MEPNSVLPERCDDTAQPNQDPPQSFLTLICGIWRHLSRRRRLQLGFLLW